MTPDPNWKKLDRKARLTAKEEAFALNIVSGKGVAESHLLAYGGNSKTEVRAVRASEVLKRGRVTARIQQLRDRAARPSVLTRARKLEKLAAMVEQDAEGLPPSHLTPEQLRAVEIDNRMQGHNEAEKLKITGLGTVLQKIRKDAKKP